MLLPRPSLGLQGALVAGLLGSLHLGRPGVFPLPLVADPRRSRQLATAQMQGARPLQPRRTAERILGLAIGLARSAVAAPRPNRLDLGAAPSCPLHVVLWVWAVCVPDRTTPSSVDVFRRVRSGTFPANKSTTVWTCAR